MNRLKAYLELTKPRLTLMALATTFTGFYLGNPAGNMDPELLFTALLGTAMVGGGANALNQYLERDVDAKMKRTEKRPLPSGRVAGNDVLRFGVLSSAFGILILSGFVNFLTGLLAFLTLTSYVFGYTPLKKKTPLNTFVGAVPGAMPCLMGWTASGGVLDFRPLALFLILFIWQLPHFFAIAWVYREDYKNGGLRMLPLYDESGAVTRRHILFYSVILAGVSLLPALIGLAGLTYLFMAIFSGTLFLGFAFYLNSQNLKHARQFVSASIVYLFCLNISMIIDKV